jgi:hypothetical protein
MLSPDQISELHRLHFVEKWSLRKIARHMRIGRRTIAKYLEAPAAKAAQIARQYGQTLLPCKGAPWRAVPRKGARILEARCRFGSGSLLGRRIHSHRG